MSDFLARNRQWAIEPPPQVGSYLTRLSPMEELIFQEWVKKNKIPFDPSETADYDMRGYWKALQSGDPHATSGMNANDGMMHFTDYYKTPYHESFSAESRWAKPNAPNWNDKDQLIDENGNVVFDERKKRK